MTLGRNARRTRDLRSELGQELRAHRLRRGIVAADLAARCEMSPSKLSKIEHGKVAVSEATLHRLAGALELSEAEETGLTLYLRLTYVGETDSTNDEWCTSCILAQESAAVTRVYAFTSVAALLQIPAYVQAMVPRWGIAPEIAQLELSRLMYTRMRCQATLWQTWKRFEITMSETALWMPALDSEGMRRQYEHILMISQMSNVSIRIVPWMRHRDEASCGWLRFDFAIFDEDVIFQDVIDTSLRYTDVPQIRRYQHYFELAQALALGEDESRDLLRDLSNGQGLHGAASVNERWVGNPHRRLI